MMGLSPDAVDYLMLLVVFLTVLFVIIIGLSIMDRKADVKRLQAIRKEGAEQ